MRMRRVAESFGGYMCDHLIASHKTVCVCEMFRELQADGVGGEKGLDRPSLPHQLH